MYEEVYKSKIIVEICLIEKKIWGEGMKGGSLKLKFYKTYFIQWFSCKQSSIDFFQILTDTLGVWFGLRK